MLSESRSHATIPVSDFERAKRFYGDVLGFSSEMDTPGGVMYACGGTRFLVYPTSSRASRQHTQIGWEVSDIKAAVADLMARGVTFEVYELPGLKTEGGIAQTGPVSSAWFRDPDGNLLSVVQLQEA